MRSQHTRTILFLKCMLTRIRDGLTSLSHMLARRQQLPVVGGGSRNARCTGQNALTFPQLSVGRMKPC